MRKLAITKYGEGLEWSVQDNAEVSLCLESHLIGVNASGSAVTILPSPPSSS